MVVNIPHTHHGGIVQRVDRIFSDVVVGILFEDRLHLPHYLIRGQLAPQNMSIARTRSTLVTTLSGSPGGAGVDARGNSTPSLSSRRFDDMIEIGKCCQD